MRLLCIHVELSLFSEASVVRFFVRWLASPWVDAYEQLLPEPADGLLPLRRIC